MKKVTKAVIPAAGMGTRMLPATKTLPKEMLPIAGKPSIHYMIEEAAASGIEDILIITARGKTVMEDYFDYLPEMEEFLRKKGRERELEIIRETATMANVHFIRQKTPLGLGHAIWCARSFVGDAPFAVLLGDDIMSSESLPVTKQLVDVMEEKGGSVVGVKWVDSDAIGKYCSLKVSKEREKLFKVHDLIEKPRPDQIMSNYAILGRYVLTPDIFDILGRIPAGYGGEIQLTDALAVQCKERDMFALDFDGRRFDTGNPTGYLEAVLEFSLRSPDTADWLKSYIKEKSKEV